LKKKREKNKPFLPFGPARPAGPPNQPAAAHLTASFSFPRRRRHLGPACQPHPLPLTFFFPTALPADPAPPREFRRAPPLPFPPSSPNRPIKAINPSLDQLEPLLSLAPSRDGRGDQWQEPPLGACSPPLAFLPLALFKLVLELLRLPLPSQRTNTLARAPNPQHRRLGFPPPLP
jgi:hypothetical protein